MKQLLCLSLFALSSIVTFSQPDPEQILAHARYTTTLNNTDLFATLKKGNIQVPVRFYMRGSDIQMQYLPFQNAEWQGIHLKFEEEECTLYKVEAETAEKESSLTKLDIDTIATPIANTDLTLEDLSLRFLCWPDPKIIGTEKIKTQSCYIIRVFNPNKDGNYSTCDLWIHRKEGALMQVKAYDWKGKLIKMFRVSDLMRHNGNYMIKTLKVETIYKNRVASISYLKFDNPQKQSPTNSRRRSLR